MKETGIIMSGNHPNLILDGIKTQTRRVIKPQPEYRDYGKGWYWKHGKMVYGLPNQGSFDDRLLGIWQACPYGQVGDRLWVRETWATHHMFDDIKPRDIPIGGPIFFVADGNPGWVKTWRPSIHMPRWASRITLEITEVRVERLQEIPLVDIKKEGIPEPNWYYYDSARDAFKDLWDSLNAKRGYGWETNPWVWVISFRRVE